MNSFKECCDNGCCAHASSDNFGGFGSPNFLSGRPSSFCRDQPQDMPPSFRSIRGLCNPTGTINGIIYASLNGDVAGRISGKIEGLPRLLGCVGSLGNLGNFGLSLPLSIQLGDRAI